MSFLGATSWADFCHADSYTPGRTHTLTTPLIIVNMVLHTCDKHNVLALYVNTVGEQSRKPKIR
jgi:hypothetical protein